MFAGRSVGGVRGGHGGCLGGLPSAERCPVSGGLLDECSKQLIGEVREPLPPQPGRVATLDSDYERKGTVNVFMAVETLAGQRTPQMAERCTRVDWAYFVPPLLLRGV